MAAVALREQHWCWWSWCSNELDIVRLLANVVEQDRCFVFDETHPNGSCSMLVLIQHLNRLFASNFSIPKMYEMPARLDRLLRMTNVRCSCSLYCFSRLCNQLFEIERMMFRRSMNSTSFDRMMIGEEC